MKNPLLPRAAVVVASWLAVGSPAVFATAPAVVAANTAASHPTGTITGRVQNVATGQYLNQARVSLKGTGQTVCTDNCGVYHLADLPTGSVVIEVFYTDLDVAQIPMTVPPGRVVEQAVELTSVARYGRNAGAVKLDAFVVSSDRETDAQATPACERQYQETEYAVQMAIGLRRTF